MYGRSFLLALGLTAGLLGSTASATAQETPQSGGTFNISFLDSAKTLDPTYSNDYAERRVLHLIYNTLVATNPDFSIRPELAKSWEIAEGGTRYVFQLQEGVTFQDGTPFDAEAVKYNIERRLDETVASAQRKQLLPVIENVEILGPLELAINLKTPYPALLAEFADRWGFMISPTAVEKFGEDFGSNPVGTGAFQLVDWTRGTSITLEKNPDYWEEGLPYLDGIVFNSVANEVIGMQRLMVGEVDYVDSLSPDQVKTVEGRNGIEIEKSPVGRWFSLQWQVDKPPFDNVTLRRAIAHALDREKINEIMMGGEGTIANGPTPPGFWWSSPDNVVYDYDPDKARELLAEAGITEGTTLTLTTPSRPDTRRLNQLVAEMLQEVGLNIELEPVEANVYYSRVVERAINFVPMTWSQRADPDGLVTILLHSDGWANTTGYANPELDALLDEARTLTTQDERKPLYAQAKDLIGEDLPYLPLFFEVSFSARKDSLHGVVQMPDTIPRFRYAWKEQ